MLQSRPSVKARPLAKSLAKLSSAAAICAALVASTSQAQVTWDAGSTTDLLWDTLTNWSLDAKPLATDAVIFPSPIPGASGNITLGIGEVALSLDFQNTYTLTGGDLALGAGGNINVAPTFTATIGSVLGGGNDVTKTGTGTLILSGANTFTGLTAVNAGILNIQNATALGTVAGGVTVAAGAELQIQGGIAVGAEALTISGTGTTATSGALHNISGTNSYAGAVTIGATGALITSDAGTLTLGSTINGAAAAAPLSFGGAGNVTVTGAIGSNIGTVSKSGAGTVTLSAAGSQTGATSITGGRIAVTNISALGTAAVSVDGATSVYEINTGAGTSVQAVNVSNGGTFQWTQNAQLTLGPALGYAGTGGTIFVGGTGSSGKVLVGAGLLTSTAGSLVTKTGGGVMQLAGANTGFLGNLSIQAGTVEFQSADSLGTAVKTVTIGGTGDLATGAVANRNNITLNTGGTISANNTAADYTGTLTMAGNGTAALRQFQATTTANSFRISGPITGAGTLTVTAPAAATLTLTGSRATHTGQVIPGTNATVAFNNASTLNVAAGIGLAGGTASVRFVNPSVAAAGTQGLNATYYNFGLNPNATTNPSQYATDLLYLAPRAFSATDLNVNMPNSGSGDWPIVPVLGYAYGVGAGGQSDGVMWKGLLNITNAGSYQFSGTDDDNYVLYIDGQQIGTLGVIATNTNIGGVVPLSAGAHSIVVKHSQGGGGGYATLSYNGGAGSDAPATTLVPGSAFTTGSLAALDLGVITSNGGTVDIGGPSSTSSLLLGNGTFALTSPTIDNLTVSSATITAATPTLAPTSGGLIFTGAIGQDVAGRALNFAGPYFAEFQGVNTYTGTTTVSGGQLRLNASGGNSIAGNLTVNAANANGALNNVQLLRSNQIADTATLTMTAGILDLGANSDTVANLTLNGGAITGTTGVLTVTNAPVLNAGLISASLAGNYNLVKGGTGTLTLAGNNIYTGVTNVNAGVLVAQAQNALGAGGVGNDTVVASGASLRTIGANMATENVTIGGTGITGDLSEAALRNLGGVTQINGLTTSAASTLRVDSGEVILNGPLNVAGGGLTKTGNGVLTFATNQATIPAVTLSAGALGFSGTQSFGAASVPAGLAFQFNSNPLAGGGSVSLTVDSTSTVVANYAADQSFLAAIAAGSTGTLALTGTNANNLNFATSANLSLGAKGLATYSGTLTPNGAGFRLGGGGGKLTINSVLAGTAPLEISGDVQLNGQNTFTGTTTIKAGGRLAYVNDSSLGTSTNSLVLDGGTLQLINPSDLTGGTGSWASLGHIGNGGGRLLTIGAGGGTIDIPARQGQGNFGMIGSPNGLTGSGALTKTGLGFLEVLSSNSYSGTLTIAANGNRFDLRAQGALPNIAGVIIESRGELDIDNNATLGSTRIFSFADNRNRFNDAASIQLNGGTLRFVGRNVAFAAGTPATSQENFGVTTIGVGQSFINSTRSGGGGADLVISNLVRNVGSGTVNFTTDGNTLGQFGDNPRIILSQINGTAPTLSAFIGGWATINQSDFAAYGANATVGGVTGTATGITNYGSTGAPAYAVLAAAAAPGAGNWTTGTVGNATASLALGAAGAGQNFNVGALRFGSGATAETITFAGTTGTPDTIFVESGGIITDNGAGAKALGVNTSNFTRGRLTAGLSTATTPQELFFHNNTAATLTINSQIIDNPNSASATVRVVKAQDGTVVLDGTNTYTGGTLVARGTLTVNSTGGLGTGSVLVKNAILNLGNKGATSSTAGISVVDQGLLVLTNNTNGAAGQYNSPGDQFNIAAGSAIYANSPGAGSGLNSLQRVTTLTGGGQIVLAPGAIVKHNVTNAPNQGAGTLTIQNLGTAADLFFAPVTAGNTAAFNQSVTVGAGTPWAGLSSDRSGTITWNAGTIFANSDFTLQGLTRDNAVTALALGENTTSASTATKSGGIQIVNNTNGPISARVVGQVAINEDEPVSMPSNLTFVLTPGSIFQPNTSMAMGFGSSQAKILVQAGGTLDPGNYTALGATANQTRNPDGSLNGFQNLPYPIPSPVNGSVSVEPGGKFVINDTSGIGSAPNGSYSFQRDSILELGSANAFFGRGNYGLTQSGPIDTTGVANPGQFVYAAGTVVRLNIDNVYKLSQFTSPDSAFVVFNGNRNITGQNNPFIIPTVGVVTIAPEDLTLSGGGMLTNDTNDRTANELRGRIVLGNNSILAGTSGTYFNIQEGLNVNPGANVTIGSSRYVDGLAKFGAVQLTGPNSTVAGAGASFTVADGAQLSFNATNVFPDTTPMSLPAAVIAYPGTGGSATQPTTGSTLLLNTANFMEYVGHVTGSGTVMANQAAALAINTTSDFTSNIVFKNTNGQQPSLMKAGPATLTLTGNSDSQGLLLSQQGSVVIASGTGDWNEIRPQRGASIVVDNSLNPTNNRLGLPAFFVGQGGTFELKGHATTPVTESFNALASGSGNFLGQAQNAMITTLKVTPGAANTTLQFLSIENYVSAGQRLASYVINSPSVANGPMTYSTASAIVPNAGNTANGLVEVAVPNFGGGVGNTGLLSGAIFGSSGSAVMPIRNDLLGDANGDGIPEGLVTQDGVNYASTNTSGTNAITGLPTTVGLSAGMLVTGTGIPAGTRIQSITNATSLVLTNNTSAAATNLNVIVGGLRNLAASEYSSTFRDNQNVGLNVKLAGANTISGDTRVQTLTLTPGSSLNISGTLPNNATSSRLLLNSSAIFVQPGGTATINGSTSGNTESFVQFIGGSGMFLHTWGDLDLNTKIHTDIGVTKTGPGTLNFGTGAFEGFRGSFELDGGTVNLAAGNRVQNVRSQNGSTGTNFYINAGTLNLNGNSQMINLLNSASELPGQGGTITSASAATILNVGGGRFAGKLDGAISLDKAGNNTLLLTDLQSYTGTTAVRAGTLVLRDSAKLAAGAGAVSIRNATLQLDNSYLSNVPNRINPATPVEMSGGTLNLTGAAGQVATQTINSLSLTGGLNNFTSNAGGSGANEVIVGNLLRVQGPNGSGASLNFNQTYGFMGTGGDTTTAIRNFIGNVNGTPLALNDGIIGGWAVVGGDHFATYRAATGVGAYTNTADGYANYESTDATTALATQNVNDGAARTFATTKTINAWRIAPNAAVTMTVNAGVGLTIDSGGLITNNNNTTTFASGGAGSFLTSNSGELDVWVNQNTTTFNVPVTGNIDLVKSGTGGTLVLGAANTYTGTTFVTGGTVNLSVAGADAGATVAVPGRLVVNAATVTETAANQLSANTDVVIAGGARLNMVNAAGVTENVRSLTFLDGTSGTGTANGFDRTALQLGSTINLTGATAITSTNTNPVTGVPFIGGFAGNVSFSNVTGSTLNVNSGVDVNGVLSVGLRFGARINNVPTGIAEGGLIKAGNGLLTLDPDQNPTIAAGTTTVGSAQITGITSTVGLVPGQQISGTNIPAGSYIISVDSASQVTINANATVAGATGTITAQSYNLFNSPTTLTDVFNIQSGVVRADRHGSLGSPFANTTVQSGAVLLGTNIATQTIIGSITLKNGSTLGATLNSFTLGAATDIAANQTILNVPSGTATIVTDDYYVPSSNSGNITINGRLTGAGNINLYGQQITQGNGGGGTITLGNPIVSGVGSNDFSGTINVGTNAILLNQIALIAKNTAVVRSTGSALGTATINLNGGRLRFRDDATTGATAVSNAVLPFGNNVTLSANSYLDAGRFTNTVDVNSGNIISLGTLTVGAGTKVLTVDSNTATTAGAGAGNYQITFNSLNADAGTFVKAGGGRVNLTSITSGSSIAIAGPAGNVLAPTFNANGGVNLVLPTTSSFANLTVAGSMITEPSKTVNLSGALTVSSNAANISGMLALTNTTTLTAASVVNNGLIGPTGGSVTLSPTTGFSGSGRYQTTTAIAPATGGATVNNQLILNGNFTAGGPKISGSTGVNDVVTLKGAVQVFTTPVEVQSGTLRFNPVVSATSAGTIRVLGAPSSIASTTSAPVSAVTGTLIFDSGANSITHTGDVTNSGIVRVGSGTSTVTGTIGGPATQYVPGLLEGFVAVNVLDSTVARPANPGNFGVQMEPRMLQTNIVTQNALTGHTDNDTWIYTGYVKDDDGVFSFAENIDDRAAVWIDGQLALNANNGGTSRVVSTAYKDGQAGTGALVVGSNLGNPVQNFGAGIALPGYGSGWHLVEIRMNNGNGGSGPIAGNGFGANYGFGYKNGIAALDGADMIKPIDDGTGNLFVTPVNAKGSIEVGASGNTSLVSLSAGRVTQTSSITLNGGLNDTTAAKLAITAAGANDADALALTGGATSFGNVELANNSTLSVGTLTAPTGGQLTVNLAGGTGTLTVTTNHNLAAVSKVILEAGTLRMNGTGGNSSAEVQVQSDSTLSVGGSLTGNVSVNGGTLVGTGTILGNVSLSGGGTIAPGNSPGILTVGTLTSDASSTFAFEIGGPGAGFGYDQVKVTGDTLNLDGATLSLSVTSAVVPNTILNIVLNQGLDADPGLFGNYTQGQQFTLGGGQQLQISYFDNPATTNVLEMSGGSSVSLLVVVPEPGAFALLLGGLGLLCNRRRRDPQH